MRWHTCRNGGAVSRSVVADLRLLSASFDFTVSVWQADPVTEQWSVESTLGALVGNKHAYFGAEFIDNEKRILAYTFGGAMHQWARNSANNDAPWKGELTVKGHFGPVTDIAWDQHNLSLFTTSQD